MTKKEFDIIWPLIHGKFADLVFSGWTKDNVYIEDRRGEIWPEIKCGDGCYYAIRFIKKIKLLNEQT